jgi:hypothetical protein
MKIFNSIVLSIITISIILSGCTDTSDELKNTNQSYQNEAEINNPKAFPWVVALIAIKLIAEVVEGKYYQDIEYYPNGQIKSTKTGCRGFVGTCSVPSRCLNNGDNLTQYPIELDSVEINETKTIYPELIKSNIGILYAINKEEYPEDCNYFFAANTKEISGELVIDNPNILKELGLNEPIVVKGEYQVIESNDYKFIIIHE